MNSYISNSIYASLLSLMVQSAVLGDPIPGLFNTGQGLSPGAQDPNYAGGGGAFAVHPHSDGVWSWVGAGGFGTLPANAQWISQHHSGAEASQAMSNTTSNYSLTFDLGGFDASSAVINFSFAVDNSLEVRLNGTLVDSLVGPLFDSGTYQALFTGVTLNSAFLQNLGTAFLAGLNTLEFRVTNTETLVPGGVNPEGLLVTISGTATPNPQGAPTAGMPEPASLVVWTMLGGVGAIAVWRRTRSIRRPSVAQTGPA